MTILIEAVTHNDPRQQRRRRRLHPLQRQQLTAANAFIFFFFFPLLFSNIISWARKCLLKRSYQTHPDVKPRLTVPDINEELCATPKMLLPVS